jgi:hypothetical protein
MKIDKLIPLFYFPLAMLAACAGNTQSGKKLAPVREINLEKINPDKFSEDEWYMPYYLSHFAEVANSVLDTGSNRGYINISVWRGTQNFHTYNARIMESILSLVWFYTTDRPWNIYYNDKALKLRIEAALDFWCRIQNDDGRFSEYGAGKWSLAPTAFSTKFIGRALWLIAKNKPKIDKEVFERSMIALRKALFTGFTSKELWSSGRTYTNQYANMWGGALMYIDIWPDEEIKSLLESRFHQSMSEFQSPCGFFYEKGGPDWGYDLSTHHSDLQVAWEYFNNTEDKDLIIKKTKDWYSWFSYNAVKEPGKSIYYLNRAIETRQQKGYFMNVEVEDPSDARWCPQAQFVPEAQPFVMSETEYKNSVHRLYQEMRQKYPDVRPLNIGEFSTYSPYAFLHYKMKMWLPSDEQKQKETANLPYLKNTRFIHFRHDNRSNTTYSFIRRPGYYAIFNSGKIITSQERYGLGLIWTPELGTVFQSQSKTDIASYGTMDAREKQVYEAKDLFPEFKINGRTFNPDEGNHDMTDGNLTVSYKLGEKGIKIIQFKEDKIVVKVSHKGGFTELLPLLMSDQDSLNISNTKILLKRNDELLTISVKGSTSIKTVDFQTTLPDKRCKVINIESAGELEYEADFR